MKTKLAALLSLAGFVAVGLPSCTAHVDADPTPAVYGSATTTTTAADPYTGTTTTRRTTTTTY